MHSLESDPYKEKKKLLTKSELSIWLDRYEDIYSDFDSRPFSERTLSDDFINELRKISKEKFSEAIELKLLMPATLRQKNTEDIIIKNLHLHFRRFAHHLKSEMKQQQKKGMLWALLGSVIMICAVYLSTVEQSLFVLKALRIMMEPAGWFFAWTGFDHIFYLSKKKKPDFEFMNQIAHADITFLSF